MLDAPQNSTLNIAKNSCFRCRGFRHSCNRQKPSCLRCEKRGIQCIYPEAAPTLRTLAITIEELDVRMKSLNRNLGLGEKIMKEWKFLNCLQKTLHLKENVEEDLDVLLQAKLRLFTNSFSIHPCKKCTKDLQSCDLTLPRCNRCENNNYLCQFEKSEPRVKTISKSIALMNRVIDQWQGLIDGWAHAVSQKTYQLTTPSKASLPFVWKIVSGPKGLSIQGNVQSFNELSNFVDQLKKSITVAPSLPLGEAANVQNMPFKDYAKPYAIWNLWCRSTHSLPQSYPIDISQDLTDSLIRLYCRTPCCSGIRIPLFNPTEFLRRYEDKDESKRPALVLVYAVCAMSARNAFQVHVWETRPSHHTPNYNMGKPLSIAYCLRGRDLISECFDQPTMDHCNAAILLSYCNYQNGYTDKMYIYEWISFTMAQELGLYNPERELTFYENLTVWCLYYFDAWYRVLRGESHLSSRPSQLYPCHPLPPLPYENQLDDLSVDEKIDQILHQAWHYFFRLQIMRDDVASMLTNKTTPDPAILQVLLEMQDKLETFYQSLPKDWKNPLVKCTNSLCTPRPEPGLTVNVHSFIQYSALFVHIHYNINIIIIHQPFLPSKSLNSTSTQALRSLDIAFRAANAISDILEAMTGRNDCHVPLIGFVFSNIIFSEMAGYNEPHKSLGRKCLERSIRIARASKTHKYDFELSHILVKMLEADVYLASQGKTPLQGGSFI
ncbi:Zn(2)-C6 fungal-specific transcription factor [Phycomyces blakesleeanus]